MALSLLTLVCLVGAALAGPYHRETEEQCATQCQPSSGDQFNYQPGNKYVYSYRGVNYITVAGGRKQQKLEITGVAEIYVQDRCEMSLQLRNIELGGEVDSEEAASLTQKLTIPLSFAWSSGQIENVCPSQEETDVSENIKKGILSAIINTMPDWKVPVVLKEVDSLGSCDTKYTVLRDLQSSVTIRKEKSLKSCDNRHTGVTALISQTYSSPESDIQSLPIFSDEKMVCEQEIQNQIIQRSVCKERAVVKPLSKHDSIVEFQGEIHLSLSSIKKVNSMPRPTSPERKSIRFAHNEDEDMESKEREISEIISELCPKTEGILHPSVSKLYYRLIMVLKGLPYSTVQRTYESLKSREICSSPKTLDIFLDALPMAGTEGSIKLMVSLLKNKEITGLKAKLWPASFALIPNPSSEAISAVLPLLESEEKSRPVLLGLSAMIYRVCSHNDCDRIPAVKEAMAVLHQALGHECSSENEDEIVSILKAFGNMGYLGPAEQTVVKCAQASDKHISVRLAAVDAFRRYNKPVPTEIKELYASPEENYEVRIAALASLIKTLDSESARAIQQVLHNDKDEQVVAYTASLVKNWKETSSPLKQNIKRQLKHIELKRENIGYWENSKNIELSAFNVPTNLGASVESNIIHAPGSKIPRSFSSKIDIDLFGTNVNIFEFGARAEGMEQALKKVFGVESKSSQKSWLPLTSRGHDSDDKKSEASFFLRTMGTEFLDLSASDLTSVGSMMQVADVVNKLAQGEKADFAHSFLFLNTKLIIPSVTGRSYVFAMVGSATVGLSADGKFDVINLASSPRNCDVEGRLQPSANIEFAATVGIHSEKSRPDIKIVTSFHSEGDVSAKFQVKDSHMIEARLDIPAKEVQLLKISTELFEVDANNNEKRIIEDMQQKIDHCIRSLEKPLGIQICGKFETPRPFVSRNFPYARGLGNLELSIKKSDPSMRGFVASLEIPKHSRDSMTYRFNVDTPGSSIKRKFQGHLELKKSSSAEREFKLDLQSPFKDITTSGSYSFQPELVQGSIVVVEDKSRRYSMKAVMEMKTTGAEKSLKPTFQWTFPGSEPASVSGSVVYSKSRKQLIMVDLRSNKAGSKPIVFTANLMKDGRLDISKRAQWKMSGDLVAKTPLFSTKIHSIIGKQAQTFTSDFSMDYETPRSQKQSIKFSSDASHSSSKASATARFETTKLPRLNWQLRWDMQGISYEALKNEILLKYGRNPENTYIRVLQSCHKGDRQSLSEGRISVQMPQFDIDSELYVAADTQPKENENFHIQADLRYKGDKHVKSLIHLKQISKSPIKVSVKAELEYPGRKMSYEDQLEERSPNVFEGRSRLQWQENQRATFQYQYKMLSDRSTIHHEMESTLHAPFLRAPLRNKGMIRASRNDLEFETQLEATSHSTYSLQAKISKSGVSKVQLQSPVLEGTMEVRNEEQKKSANVDVQLRMSRPRRITATAAVSLDSKKSLEAELLWDADKDQSRKILLSTEVELSGKRSRSSYTIASKLQLLDLLAIDVSAQGKCSLEGTHELTLEVSGRNFENFGLTARQESTPESIQFSSTLKRNQRKKATVELQGHLSQTSSETELQFSASLKSAEHSFEDKSIQIKHTYAPSRSSMHLQSSIELQFQTGKQHRAEVEYTSDQRKVRNLKVSVETPHQHFQHQEISLSHQQDSDSHAVRAQVKFDRKEIVLSSNFKNSQDGYSVTCTLSSPFHALRDIKLQAQLENKRALKQIQCSLDVNGNRKCEISANYASRQGRTELQSSFKSSMHSEISIDIKTEVEQPSFSHELVIMKDSSRVVSFKMSKQSSNDESTLQFDLKKGKQTILDVKALKESKRSSDKYVIKANGPFSPISLSTQVIKSDESSVSLLASACRESSQRQCYNLKGYYKREAGSSKSKKYHKITLDVEQITGQSQVKHICNIHYLLAQQGNSLKSKLLLDSREKRIGYEFNFQNRHHQEDEPCQMDIHLFLPSRTMRSMVSIIHSSQQLTYSLEITPDTSAPTEKLAGEISLDKTRSREVSGHVSFNHNALQKPVVVKYQMQRSSSQMPVSAKIELDYSEDSKDKLTAEVTLQNERKQLSQKTLVARLWNGGQDLDLTLKLSQQQSRQRDVYVCDWSWKSQRSSERSGSLSLKLSDKTSNWPQTAEIAVECPSVQMTAIAQTKWESSMPSEVQLKLLSKQRQLGEISYQWEGQCADLKIKSSEPILKNHLCIKKNEQQRVKLFSLESYYREHKAIDMSIDLDPSRAHVANIAVQWKKEHLRSALQSLNELKPSMKSFKMQKVCQELQQSAEDILTPMQQKVLQPLASAMAQQCRRIWEEQVDYINYIKEFFRELARKLPQIPSLDEILEKLQGRLGDFILYCREKVVDYFENFTPAWIKELFEKVKDAVQSLFHRVCKKYYLCHQIQNTYQRRGMKHVHKLLRSTASDKLSEMRQKSQRNWNEVCKYFERLVQRVRDYTEEYMEKIKKMVPEINELSFVKEAKDMYRRYWDYVKTRVEKYFEKAIEAFNKLMDHALNSKDMQVLTSLFREMKDEAEKTLKNFDAKKMLQPLRENVLEKYPRMWIRERVDVQDYDLDQGNIRVQLHHPLDQSKVQLLRNTLVVIRNKYQSKK